jgi:ribose 5-phosphate isomerase B
MEQKRIHIASDHGGYRLKEFLKIYLIEIGYEADDLGTYSEESVDYPLFGQKAAEAVLKDGEPAIIICGTGIGISISANRFKGIRAALCHSAEYARLSRQHNNSNILALGGRFIGFEAAKDIVKVFLDTEFEGGRHQNRIDLIDKI